MCIVLHCSFKCLVWLISHQLDLVLCFKNLTVAFQLPPSTVIPTYSVCLSACCIFSACFRCHLNSKFLANQRVLLAQFSLTRASALPGIASGLGLRNYIWAISLFLPLSSLRRLFLIGLPSLWCCWAVTWKAVSFSLVPTSNQSVIWVLVIFILHFSTISPSFPFLLS